MHPAYARLGFKFMCKSLILRYITAKIASFGATRYCPARRMTGILVCIFTVLASSFALDVIAAENLNAELIIAARKGQISVVEWLLEKGADVNAVTLSGKSSLMGAAIYGNKRVVNLLVSEGANVNAKDKLGSTALIDAAFSGDVSIVRSLLAKGANTTVKANNGATALSTAKARGNAVVAALLESLAGGSGSADKRKGKKSKKKKKKKKRKKKK